VNAICIAPGGQISPCAKMRLPGVYNLVRATRQPHVSRHTAGAASIRTAGIVRNLLIFQSVIRSKGLPWHTVSFSPGRGVWGRVSSRAGRHRRNPEPRYREDVGCSRMPLWKQDTRIRFNGLAGEEKAAVAPRDAS
jgi:hypothetical protein